MRRWAFSAIVLLALLSLAGCDGGRADSFIGYAEVAADATEPCSDELELEICSMYKESGDCSKGYIKNACLQTCGACPPPRT
ncbi:hypothetical protein ACKKBG_A29655 [Auxenochlorella protothecoides x Auxenochlorella symbiontica]